MSDKPSKIKTYISEANQNRISDTLSVTDKGESADTTNSHTVDNTRSSDLSKEETQELVNEESGEPESLSAEAEYLPPTTASADAEAVAGMPVGGVHGQEGDMKAAPDVAEEKESK